MAVPSYTTDLTTLAIGDLNVDAGTWDESSNASWDDAGSMVDDQNLYYNHTQCVSAQYTKTGVGTIMYAHTSSVTVPTDGAVLIHHLWAAPPALNSLATGGVRVLVGNSIGTFYGWNASGNDFAPAPRGGWTNYAINPAIASPDYTVGSPASPYSTFGIAVAALQQARGNPNACNAIRYGRCESRFTNGQAGDYATFAGFGVVDDATTARWNLLEPVGTSGFTFQGLMSLGLAGTPVDFRDSNKSINIKDTINVTSNFNKIEVHNASSNIEWDAISITALGTVSEGIFDVVDNATVTKKACTFTGMGWFTYQSNSTISHITKYIQCGLVTQGGATFTDVIFDKASGAIALLVSNLSLITKCTFNSDGSSYGADLGTISASATYTWNNFESGHVAGSSGVDVGVTGTGNETIKVNVATSQVLTINIGTGASIPSVANSGAGTVNIVAGLSKLDFTLSPAITGYEWRIYTVTAVGSLVGASGVAGEESATVSNQSYSYTYSAGVKFAIQIIPKTNDYEESITYYSATATDQDLTINLKKDINN